MEQTRPGQFGALVITMAFSLVLGLPMLLHGPLVDGHDVNEHRNFTKHVSEQFWGGELYPRWLINMNHGLGSPSFFVFPPLPAYLSVLIEPIAKALHFDAFIFAGFLPLLGSGICAFLWLHTFVNKNVAVASAVLYMLMPYHLVIDFYRRFAISECWAFVWMPLILYLAHPVAARRRYALIGMAIACALLIFSHVISLVMFFPIPIAVAVVQSRTGQKLRSAIEVFAAMALGAGLAAVYLLPALANAPYIPASRLVSREFYQLPNQLLSFGKALLAASTSNGWLRFLQLISWTAVSMSILIVVCVGATYKAWPKDMKRMATLWAVVCVLSLFMMSTISTPLWSHFSLLQQAVQFPWRFNVLLCLAALWFFAMFLSRVAVVSGLMRTTALCVVLVVVAGWLVAYGNIWRHYRVALPPGPPNERHLISDNDGWLPAWLPPGTDQRSALVASTQPKVRFKEGFGAVHVTTWKARLIEFETESANGGTVMINQFYYPTWRAKAVESGTALGVQAALPEGLLQVSVGKGVHKIRVDLPVSFAEHAGTWISVLCALLCVLPFMKKRSKFSSDETDRQPTLAVGAPS